MIKLKIFVPIFAITFIFKSAMCQVMNKTYTVAWVKEIYIEKDDFEEIPPKGYFRLSPDREVRLKGAYYIKCVSVDAAGLNDILYRYF